MAGRAYVGTSGWSYASWKPKFYPPEVKSKDFLAYYATRLATLEINYTFNHLPTSKNIEGWRAGTPDGFLFALKASQYITHVDQLRHPADTLGKFFDAALPLADRLGPVLFQCPPWLKRDDERLAGFVAELPADRRCAMEFRDASWYAPEVYGILGARNVALCHAEGEKAPSPLETAGAAADFAYLRLRAREGYDDAAIATWTDRCAALLAAGKDVYAYFRHDDDGSNGLAALRLRDLLATRTPPSC